MTHIRFRTLMMVFTVTCSMVVGPAVAEIYKYVDQNGIVHFTDNLSTVPESYRGQLERSNEIQKPWPPETTPENIEGTDNTGDTYDAADEPAQNRIAPRETASSAGNSAAEGETTDLAVEELSRKRNALMDKKEQLNQQYQSLLKQRRELEAEHQSLETPEAVENYNQQVQALNEKIQEYREKRSDLEMEIQEFNATLQAPEAMQEQ